MSEIENAEGSESNLIVRDMSQYASYPTAAGHSDDGKVEAAKPEEKALNLDDLSAKEIDAYVNSGDLTPEQVYEHENASEHPRKGVLRKYAPKDNEPEAEESDADAS